MLTLTVVGIFHQAFVDGNYTVLLFKVLGAEMCAFVGFWVYWMILYPHYFTPFWDLPTPSVCIVVLLALHRRQPNNEVASNDFDGKLPRPLPG